MNCAVMQSKSLSNVRHPVNKVAAKRNVRRIWVVGEWRYILGLSFLHVQVKISCVNVEKFVNFGAWHLHFCGGGRR